MLLEISTRSCKLPIPLNIRPWVNQWNKSIGQYIDSDDIEYCYKFTWKKLFCFLSPNNPWAGMWLCCCQFDDPNNKSWANLRFWNINNSVYTLWTWEFLCKCVNLGIFVSMCVNLGIFVSVCVNLGIFVSVCVNLF